jgi:diguanylate cyclase (GGDEF)-like protein/PAS domain S-box-containing protein
MDADLFVDTPPARARWRERLAAWHPRQWLGTLKARLAAGVLAALLAGMAWAAWQMGQVAERELLTQAQQREQREAQRTAAVIGRRLAELQRALEAVAQRMDPALAGDAAKLEAFLVGQPVLLTAFHYVNVAGVDGRVLISVDERSVRRPQVSIADRPHFQRTLVERRAQISQPLPGRVADEPVVVFTQPVLDARGDVAAVLLGVLRLASRDLLADLAEARDDDHGTIVVVTDDHGTIIAHPQRAMLLRQLADEPRLASTYLQWEAEARPLQRDVGHWRQHGEVVAMAGEAAAGWHVWRAAPRDVLLAPLARGRTQALQQAGGVAALLAVAMVAFFAWQLRPLRHLERRAARLLAGDDDASAGWPEASGEIGRLARTLRHVWAERAQVESFNAQVLGKLGSVMAAAPVGIAFLRAQRFELVSSEFCRLFGRREADLLGQGAGLVFAAHDDYVAFGEQIAAAFSTGAPYTGEWQFLHADGSSFWGRLRSRPVDAADPAAGEIWTLNDVTEQRAEREQLEWSATHDVLTGLANRKAFEARLRRLFAGRPASLPAALVMIDLDHFKPINDRAGHAAGDAMLRAVAGAIGARVRATDLVVRLGGDEFAVLLEHCEHDVALAVAEKLRQAVHGVALPWQGHTLRVGASLGVASLEADTASAEAWLEAADAACYAAKHGGRGAVRAAKQPALRLVVGDS